MQGENGLAPGSEDKEYTTTCTTLNLSAGDEIARKIAEVAKAVYITARTYTNPNRPEPRSNVHHVSWLKSLNEDGSISFLGGECLQADSIIYATGYKYTYPFLQRAGLLDTGDKLTSLRLILQSRRLIRPDIA